MGGVAGQIVVVVNSGDDRAGIRPIQHKEILLLGRLASGIHPPQQCTLADCTYMQGDDPSRCRDEYICW